MKIYAQQSGSYTKQELLDMATLLIKGGYTVRRGKVKIDGKPVEYVEFFGDPKPTEEISKTTTEKEE